jgi:hypothetical protein
MQIVRRTLIAAILLLAPAVGRPSTVTVDLGGLKLVVSDAQTAQLFHVVDQLSQWDEYSHKQYVRWAAKSLALGPEDNALLAKHAELRRHRGWGHGFEQAFLVDDSIDGAAAKAVLSGLLDTQEADSERAILTHFAPILAPLLKEQQPQLEAFQARLAAAGPQLGPTILKLMAFAEVKEVLTVPVFLVSDPDEKNGGGEANGGHIVVEVRPHESMGVLLHESLHALLMPHGEAIKAAAQSAGIDVTVLNEGIAYALYPGLFPNSDGDQLADELVGMLVRGKPAADNYVKFDMMAVVLRPLLQQALSRQETISAFLPRAVEKWRRVAGTQGAPQTTGTPPPGELTNAVNPK